MVTKSKRTFFNSSYCSAEIDDSTDKKPWVREIKAFYKGGEVYFQSLADFEKWLMELNELHKLLTQEKK